jgi:hypothetical protein
MKETAHEYGKYVTSLASQAITVATVNGGFVDTQNFHEALVVLDSGALGGTLPTLAVKVQEAPVDPANPGNPLASAWADVPAAVFTVLNAGNTPVAPLVGRLNTDLRQRFLRLVATGGGTGPTGSFHGGIYLGLASVLQVTQVNTPVQFSI